jgi:hypothetical protein
MTTLSQATLLAAIASFEAEQKVIEDHLFECRKLLREMTDIPPGKPVPVSTTPRKRTSSAAGRKSIAEAMRKRWAAKKQAAPAPEAVAKPKRKVSAAARERMALAQQKRWAALKQKTMTAGA